MDDIFQYEWLEPNIVKFQVAAGVEVTEDLALAAYQRLFAEANGPIAVINDRINDYENSLEVLMNSGGLEGVVFQAVVLHDEADRPVVETQQMMNPSLKVFTSLEAAISAARQAVAS